MAAPDEAAEGVPGPEEAALQEPHLAGVVGHQGAVLQGAPLHLPGVGVDQRVAIGIEGWGIDQTEEVILSHGLRNVIVEVTLEGFPDRIS